MTTMIQPTTQQQQPDTKDLSLVRFFNCHDLSDCTLEITEQSSAGSGKEQDQVDCDSDKESNQLMPLRTVIKAESVNHKDENGIDLVDCKKLEQHSAKRQKLEQCLSIFEQAKDSTTGAINNKNNKNSKKTILFIHSLLFCSNSEYFQKLLMSSLRPKNIQLHLQKGETENFIKLVKLFYDSSPIQDMSLLEATKILKFANQFECSGVSKRLLEHISCSRIRSIAILNQCVSVFNEICSSHNQKELVEVVIQLKKACVGFLKTMFCPMEKVFGPTLTDFLELSFDSLMFLLNFVTNGIAVSEETVVTLCLYWAQHTRYLKHEQRASMAMTVLEHCWIEHMNGTTFLMNALSLEHPFLSKSKKFLDFYIYALEYLSCNDKPSYFPDQLKRLDRKRNFALDHDAMLCFTPRKVSSTASPKYHPDMLLELRTDHKNVFFVQGYQVHLSAAIFMNGKNRELKVKARVSNLTRYPHSPLFFSLLYAIASPSVSENFSPWSHCAFKVDSADNHAWGLISLIAEHSKITETGFYLKFYIE